MGSTLTRDWALGAVRLSPRVAIQTYQDYDGAFHERGGGEFNLRMSAGHATGVYAESGLGWQWPVATRWAFRGDASLIQHLAYRGSSRLAYLDGLDQAFTIKGAEGRSFDHQLNLGLDYRHRAMVVNVGVKSQRLHGENDQNVVTSLAYSF
jgi:hypothetical protein